MDVSQIARWPGKSALDALPAPYHMLDVAAVAEVLLADHPRRGAFSLLIARHDLGKIGNRFRAMLLEGTLQGHRH